jgi:hypothetical protein
MRGILIKNLFLWFSLGLTVVAAAGALAGCGGGGDSASGTTLTTSSHSKAEYVKLANAICKKGREATLGKIGAFMEARNGGKESKAQDGNLFAKALQTIFLPAIQTQVEEIRSLGAPEGDEQQVEALLTALQEASDAHRQGTVKSQNVFEKDFKRSGELASKYGLDECSYAS